MATLQYTVWPDAKQVALGDVINENVITIGGASAQGGLIDSAASTGAHRYVRVAADADCWVTWGSDPTAVADTGGRMVFSGQPEYWYMEAGFKIACITRA
jgi:hypothetical protein